MMLVGFRPAASNAMQGIESKGLLLLAWVFLVVLLPTLALGAARFEPAPAAGATLRGLYALSQSVNGTNAPDSPAQLLTLSDTTGEFQVVGPVVDAQGNPLWFSSVTGWPFYSGGAAVGGRTYSVLQRPDGTPVLATIDLATGKAIETLALKDVGAIFGLFMIAAVDGEPYGAVLRYVRQSSFIDVGPILANGSVARQVSFKHFVLVSQAISGGKYFGFLRDDVGHELVDVAKGTVVDVIGRSCWYNNQWINVAPGIMRGPAGFVQPSTGAPFALISRKPVDGQGGFMLSLARLNDSSAPGTTRYCQIEWLVDIVPLDGHGLAQSAYDPTTDQFHVLVGKTGPSWSFTLTSLVTIDINERSVRQVDLSWPNAFRGGIRQLINHV